jgi:glycosyltransferase involved in cell wall biosynthesis
MGGKLAEPPGNFPPPFPADVSAVILHQLAMKLGIISTTGNLYSWAGSEETWRTFAAYALAQGHQFNLLLPEKVSKSEPVNALRQAGAAVAVRGELSPMQRRLAVRGWYSRFKRFFTERYDAIFISTGGIADCAWFPDLLPEIERCQSPLVFFIQSNAEGMVGEQAVRDSLRRIYQRAALVVFLSQHNQRLAERQLAWRFPQSRILMNPLRTPMSQPLPWPDALNGLLRMAEVARLEVADKRQDQLLEALSTDTWKSRNWSLTFFGLGPDENHIQQLIHFYGLDDKVCLGGQLPDFRQIWQHHHLHILPSSREGMPLAIIESMFCGRPALVTRAGGNAELVRDGVDGFVSPGMHPEIIRETLERAWAARDRWQAMGLSAFARVEQVVPKDWAAQMLALVESAAVK